MRTYKGSAAFLKAAIRVDKGLNEFSCPALAQVSSNRKQRLFYEDLYELGPGGYRRLFSVERSEYGHIEFPKEECKQRRVIALLLAREVWLSEGNR